MKKYKLNKRKGRKDVDSVTLSLFVKSLVWTLSSSFMIGSIYGFIFGGIYGALIFVSVGSIVSVFASLLIVFISDKFGEFANVLFRGPKANWSIRERFEGDLNQVRYYKMNKRFDAALSKVDEVLMKVPNYVDALYLKASILWEGFKKPTEAKHHLGTILKMTSETDNYHIWASELYKNIVKEEENRLNKNFNNKM